MTNVKDFIIKDGVLIKYTGSDPNVIIPDGIIEIGEEAFKSNKNLKTVVIPNGVTCVGVSAFENCENLTSVTIFDSVEHICAYAFMNTGLANIVIQNGIIDWMAFRGCTSLTNVTLGDNVTKIGGYAFDECESLTNVCLPEQIEDGYCAFSRSINIITFSGKGYSDYKAYLKDAKVFKRSKKLKKVSNKFENAIRNSLSAEIRNLTKDLGLTDEQIKMLIESAVDSWEPGLYEDMIDCACEAIDEAQIDGFIPCF